MPRPRLHLDPIPEILPPEPRRISHPTRPTEAQALARVAQGLAIVTDALRQLVEAQQHPLPEQQPDCPWITAAEAARRLGRHKSTVNKLIAVGAIPTRLVGHLRYVDWQAFTERKEAKE